MYQNNLKMKLKQGGNNSNTIIKKNQTKNPTKRQTKKNPPKPKIFKM